MMKSYPCPSRFIQHGGVADHWSEIIPIKSQAESHWGLLSPTFQELIKKKSKKTNSQTVSFPPGFS